MHPIKRIFLRNFKKILQCEKSDTEHIFTSPPLLAYRRDTNLKWLLVRSSLNLKPNGTHPCGHSLCHTCEHTIPSDAISGPKNTFHIQHHFTCSSVYVVYSITCTKCSTLYIGETCCQLNTRFGEHLRSVEEKKHPSPEYQDDDDINVAIHFSLPNHSIDDMGISALLYAPTEKLPRKTLEKKIIFELGTITPSGLNKQFSFLVYSMKILWDYFCLITHLVPSPFFPYYTDCVVFFSIPPLPVSIFIHFRPFITLHYL